MRVPHLAIAALLCAVAVAPGHAQIKASTVPISRDTVTLRLLVADSPATVTVQNGGLARVALKDGPAMGLVPAITTRGIELVVFEITTDPATGNEGLRQVAKSALTRGKAVRFDNIALPFEVEFVETKPAAGQGATASGPCTTCCVMCGAILYCGCLVITECGQCCCPSACTCPGPPTEGSCAAARIDSSKGRAGGR